MQKREQGGGESWRARRRRRRRDRQRELKNQTRKTQFWKPGSES